MIGNGSGGIILATLIVKNSNDKSSGVSGAQLADSTVQWVPVTVLYFLLPQVPGQSVGRQFTDRYLDLLLQKSFAKVPVSELCDTSYVLVRCSRSKVSPALGTSIIGRLLPTAAAADTAGPVSGGGVDLKLMQKFCVVAALQSPDAPGASEWLQRTAAALLAGYQPATMADAVNLLSAFMTLGVTPAGGWKTRFERDFWAESPNLTGTEIASGLRLFVAYDAPLPIAVPRAAAKAMTAKIAALTVADCVDLLEALAGSRWRPSWEWAPKILERIQIQMIGEPLTTPQCAQALAALASIGWQYSADSSTAAVLLLMLDRVEAGAASLTYSPEALTAALQGLQHFSAVLSVGPAALDEFKGALRAWLVDGEVSGDAAQVSCRGAGRGWGPQQRLVLRHHERFIYVALHEVLIPSSRICNYHHDD